MTRFKNHRCAHCHGVRQEQEMIQAGEKFYCCIQCKLKHERKSYARDDPCDPVVVPYKPRKR